jgi:hypothetical protein
MNVSKMIIFYWGNFEVCNSDSEPVLEMAFLDLFVGYGRDRRNLDMRNGYLRQEVLCNLFHLLLLFPPVLVGLILLSKSLKQLIL